MRYCLSRYNVSMDKEQQVSRINDVLYAIHKDIAGDLSAKHLCRIASYSEQHFHRVFSLITGETLHQYVIRTRLEHAANQLMFDPRTPVLEIAQKCGFLSLSSFSRAFKNRFHCSPGRWRRVGADVSEKPNIYDAEIARGYTLVKPLPLGEPIIEEREPQHVAYIRHVGYGREIRRTWERLRNWALIENHELELQIGLHHSNPALVPLQTLPICSLFRHSVSFAAPWHCK